MNKKIYEVGLMAQMAASLMPPDPVEQFVRETPKVGRNEPCPCGSGKKSKKCCTSK